MPKGVSVLRGARVDHDEGREVIENADIVVTDNRITAIGKRGSVKIPNGAHVDGRLGQDDHAGLRRHARAPARGVEHPSRRAVELRGEPRVRRNDGARSADGRDGRAVVRRRSARRATCLDRASTRRARACSRIPACATSSRRVACCSRYSDYYDTKTIKEYETGNREVRQWIIQAANELQLMPTTEGGLDYVMNMTEAIDGYSGHEHTIPTYPLHSDVIKLLVESGITYTPTLLVAYGGPWIGELLVRARGRVQRSEAASASRRGTISTRRSSVAAARTIRRRTARRPAGSPTISTSTNIVGRRHQELSSRPAAAPASAHTANCRDLAIIGRCGRSRWAA